MSISEPGELEGDASLKGKEFDEVCERLRDVENIKGYVHKKPDAGGKWAYCFSFVPIEYSEVELLDLIVSEYGPGEYPVQFKDNTGRPQIRWQKNMQVQARRLGAHVQTPQPAAGHNDALAVAIENQSRMLEALLTRLATAPPPVEQKSTIEIAKELAALKDLFTDNKQTVLEQVKDVLELKQMLMENGDAPADPIAAALKYLGPAIERGMQSQTSAAPTAAVSTPPPAAPREAPRDPIPETIAIDQAFVYFAHKYLPALMQVAEHKQEPEAVADYLARLIGNNQDELERIGLVLSQDDMVQRFAGFDSRVMEFAGWFDLVGDWLAYALWPDANDRPEPRSATINATINEARASSGINGPEPQGDQYDALDSVDDDDPIDESGSKLSPTRDDNDA